MRFAKTAIIGIAALSLCVAADMQKTAHIDDITYCKITGKLGKPMGTICRIQGTAKAIGIPGHKYDGADAVWMDIDTVDGVAINPTVRLDTSEDVSGLAKPLKAGDLFNLVACESGYFCGPTSDPNHLNPSPNDMLLTQNNYGGIYQIREKLNIITPESKK